ncbi:hypothetical protein Ahia01_001373700, partial [Argonauta hians]
MAGVRGDKKRDRDSVFERKIPVNPRYRHITTTLDTGASLSKYLAKIEDIRKNYRYKKDELFKRMKWTTFVQLVLQISELNRSKEGDSQLDSARGDVCGDGAAVSARPDTADTVAADREVESIQNSC